MNSSLNAPLYLCLYFKKLPLEVFSRTNSEGLLEDSLEGSLEGSLEEPPPIVITEKQRVFFMDDKAQDMGIQLGNNMDTAYSLSDQILCFERNEDKEISTLSHLAQWAYQFTPKVSIKSPYCLLLDITGCLSLFKGLDKLVQKVEEGLDKLGYQAIIALNTTPLAALLLAKAQKDTDVINTSLFNTSPAKLKESIASISVNYLDTDEKNITALKQMGIANLETLLSLPPSGINRRFGTYFANYLQRLKGDIPDPQKIISPKARFLSTINFLFDLNNLNSLVFPIKRLIGELEDFLRGRQLTINHFTWQLSHRNTNNEDGKRSFSISLASPINDAKAFLTLTQLKLDQIKDVKEVDSISLIVNRFYPASSHNKTLFDDVLFDQHTSQLNQDRNKQLLNILNAKLGSGHCFGLSLSDDHRPEKAWKAVPINKALVCSTKEGSLEGSLEDSLEDSLEGSLEDIDPLPRPSFLLDTPKALRSAENQPYLAGKLTLLKGPERIDYGWWDQSINKPLARDYYIAAQNDGSLYWVFKYIAMERWYLHGIFS